MLTRLNEFPNTPEVSFRPSAAPPPCPLDTRYSYRRRPMVTRRRPPHSVSPACTFFLSDDRYHRDPGGEI